MDMSAFVAPRSDQLNADDLIAGPRTIIITRVVGTGNADQPVAVFFDGDDGKPLKPCKSMRRVMIAAWGVDASRYVGRSMTLFRDPKVKFGGMEVGGIRISHMSDIERDMVMALTVTKAKREPYRVQVLRGARLDASHSTSPAPTASTHTDNTQARVDAMLAEIADAQDMQSLFGVIDRTLKAREWLKAKRPDLHDLVHDALNARREKLEDAGVPS